MSDTKAGALLALTAESSELRVRLAELQDECIELAVDAGNLHAEVEALKAQLAAAAQERDTWRAEAEHYRRRAVA